MLLNCGLEKTLESPLDCKIKSVHPKEDQSWVFIERTDAEAEPPILWPPDSKSWLIGKDPDAGKDWRQEKKETTEDEMVGWHHQLNGHEFEQAPTSKMGKDREAWRAAVDGVANSQTRLSNWTTTVYGADEDMGTCTFAAQFSVNLELLEKIKSIDFLWSPLILLKKAKKAMGSKHDWFVHLLVYELVLLAVNNSIKVATEKLNLKFICAHKLWHVNKNLWWRQKGFHVRNFLHKVEISLKFFHILDMNYLDTHLNKYNQT